MRRALRRLIAEDASIGLVVFSDVAYELLPPGTPASEMRPMLRLLIPPRLGTPVNPWTQTFRAGTRISAALELARGMLERDDVKAGSILLVSDLETAPDDVPAVASTVDALRRSSIELRVFALAPSNDARVIFEGFLDEGAFAAPETETERGRVGDERRYRFPRAPRAARRALLPRARRARALRRRPGRHRRLAGAHMSRRELTKRVAAAVGCLVCLLLAAASRPARRGRRALARSLAAGDVRYRVASTDPRLWTPGPACRSPARGSARDRRRHRLPAGASRAASCPARGPGRVRPGARGQPQRGAGSPGGGRDRRRRPRDPLACGEPARSARARPLRVTRRRDAGRSCRHAREPQLGDRHRSRERRAEVQPGARVPARAWPRAERGAAGTEPAPGGQRRARARARASPAAGTRRWRPSCSCFSSPRRSRSQRWASCLPTRARSSSCDGGRDASRGTLGLVEPRVAARRHARDVIATGALLGVAAAQPVVEQTRTAPRAPTPRRSSSSTSRGRCWPAVALDGEERIDRAKRIAQEIRSSLAEIRFGVVSITDRMLPHLFPSADGDVFDATLERSLGIEQPPPRSSLRRARPTSKRSRPSAGSATSRRSRASDSWSCSRTVSRSRSPARGWGRFCAAAGDESCSCTSGTRTSASSQGAPGAAVPPRSRRPRDPRRAREADRRQRVLGERGRAAMQKAAEPPRWRPDDRPRRASRARAARALLRRCRARPARSAAAPADR